MSTLYPKIKETFETMVRDLRLKDDEEGKEKKAKAVAAANKMYDLDTRLDIDVKNIFVSLDRIIDEADINIDTRELKKEILENMKQNV